MDNIFCSFSPLFPREDLVENSIFSSIFPEFEIPQNGDPFENITGFVPQIVEENNQQKEKKRQKDNAKEKEKPSRKDCVEKKIIHRDTERRRRQETAALHASLRSVLPPQQIKGKRSISDQLHEATKHIQLLQKRITELQFKRDNLKKSQYENGNSTKVLPIAVRVQRCRVGLEVLITSETYVNIPLSRLMRFLLQEGLLVVSYNSTMIDGKFNYMIQSEVNDAYSGVVDLDVLQRKISYMINTWA